MGRLEQLKQMSSDPKKVEDSIAQVKLTLRLRQYVWDPWRQCLYGSGVISMGGRQRFARKRAVLSLGHKPSLAFLFFPPVAVCLALLVSLRLTVIGFVCAV